jgi:arsenate reductase-like glutaredoxin family protein
MQHPLQMPIQLSETITAIKSLNNGRAAGPDGLFAEYFKYGGNTVAYDLTKRFNSMFETREKDTELELNQGILLPIPKPGKALAAKNTRAIILVNINRKILSLITKARIQPAAESFLSPSQSGFRPGRSTADAVFALRMHVTRSRKFIATNLRILGLDFSSAFDTMIREQLLANMETLVDEDELRLIAVLLSNTSLRIRLNGEMSEEFWTTIGTPQGDGLSPLLFILYLEFALRVLRTEFARRGIEADESMYADDADFLVHDDAAVSQIIEIAPTVFGPFNLCLNESKTEITKLGRDVSQFDTTSKLGSLLDDSKDIIRRVAISNNAMHGYHKMWMRSRFISEAMRLRLYKCYVLPILLYNCGTWGLNVQNLNRLEACHRKQLKRTIGIYWPQVITTKDLYKRCNARRLGYRIMESRWKLFGHILRLPVNIPAYQTMLAYFEDTGKRERGRDVTSILRTLRQDIKEYMPQQHLACVYDLLQLRCLAQDRTAWVENIETMMKKMEEKDNILSD